MMTKELNNILRDPVKTILEIQVTKYEMKFSMRLKSKIFLCKGINPFDLFMY